MEFDDPNHKRKAAKWKDISIVFWFALIFGVVFAFGSYIGVIAPKSEWMRQLFMDDVRHDSISAFSRRFMIGAGGGAVIGILSFIRDRKDGA
jgi:hypothetical protein